MMNTSYIDSLLFFLDRPELPEGREALGGAVCDGSGAAAVAAELGGQVGEEQHGQAVEALEGEPGEIGGAGTGLSSRCGRVGAVAGASRSIQGLFTSCSGASAPPSRGWPRAATMREVLEEECGRAGRFSGDLRRTRR